MTSLFPAQRRAERFDSLVEGGRHDDADSATVELLELVGALRSMPEAAPRPEFVADLRERLLLAAETELVVTPGAHGRDAERLTIKPRRTHRERRVGIALGAVAVIGATTSMAVASQSALPGDSLYPVKRAIENTQAGFSVGDDAKGETILDSASTRLDEVDELTQKNDPDAGLVTETLDTFSDQATEASDSLMSDYEHNGHQDSISQIHAFATDSLAALTELKPVIPASAHDALLNAAMLVFNIDSAATNVCPDCGDGLTELPAQLVAGGTQTVDDTTGALAGGALPGTQASASSGDQASGPQHQGNGGKGGGKPSGLNPPETPVTIPTDVPTPPSDSASGIGTLLPTAGTNTGGGNGGHGGKHKPKPPVDLGPVTDTVNEVVNGVVDGVTDVLNGLSGSNKLAGT